MTNTNDRADVAANPTVAWKCNCCMTVFEAQIERGTDANYPGPNCPHCKALNQYTYPHGAPAIAAVIEKRYAFECEAGPLGKCVEWQQLRAAISSAVPDGGKGEAVISRPDWLRIFGTHFEVNSTWDDGTPRGVYCDGYSFDEFRREIESLYTAPQAECAPRADALNARDVELLTAYAEGSKSAEISNAARRVAACMAAPRALTDAQIVEYGRSFPALLELLTRDVARVAFVQCVRAIEQAVNKGAGNA